MLRNTVWALSNTLQEYNINNDGSEIIKNAVIIKYGQELGIVVNVINTCVEAYPKEYKKHFYRSRQDLIDKAIKRGFSIDSLLKRYKPSNDKVWGYYRKSLFKCVKRFKSKGYNADAYAELMNHSIHSFYSYTEKYSNLNANYIFIKKMGATVEDIKLLYNNFSITCAKVQPVDMQELDEVLSQYYGDNIKASSEVPRILGTKNPGIIEYVGYIDDKGEFVIENETPSIKLPREYIPSIKVEKVDPLKNKAGMKVSAPDTIFYKDI